MVHHQEQIPVIGITMGDPAGIGPEITLKALSQLAGTDSGRYLIVGDKAHLDQLVRQHSLAIDLVRVGSPAESSATVAVHDLANLPPSFETGGDNAVTGKASAEYILAAVELWKRGVIDAIATAPISKKAISLGGFDFPGHTEFLASLTDTNRFAMSFFAGDLRVVLLSTHVSLRSAIGMLDKKALVERISFADEMLSRILGRAVTIAVAGLNPHASEGGMFGSEEADIIEPAIEECRALGINVFGPFAPDTVFLRGYRGEFDTVIALYHDQATIAVKSLSFGSGVNVTLGLPLIRTSVDHGTAFDIAGRWVADASSMAAAIRLAGELAVSSRASQCI